MTGRHLRDGLGGSWRAGDAGRYQLDVPAHGPCEQPRVGAVAGRDHGSPIGVSSSANDDIWVKPLPSGSALPRVLRSASRTFDLTGPRTGDPSCSSRLARRTWRLYAPPRGRRRRAIPCSYQRTSWTRRCSSPDARWLVLRQGSVGAIAGGRNITGLRFGADTTPQPGAGHGIRRGSASRSPRTASGWPISPTRPGAPRCSCAHSRTRTLARSRSRSGGGLAPLWSQRRQGALLPEQRQEDDGGPTEPPESRSDCSRPRGARSASREELLAVEALYYTPWDVARDGRIHHGAAGQWRPAIRPELIIVVARIGSSELKAEGEASDRPTAPASPPPSPTATGSSVSSARAAWPPCIWRTTSGTIEGGAQGAPARARGRARRRAVPEEIGHRRAAAPPHPAAARLGRGRGLLYYVMPFVEGETLRERLSASSSCRWTSACARPRGGRRAGLRAPPRRHSPRHQAREHPAARRPCDDGRLRHRARGRAAAARA